MQDRPSRKTLRAPSWDYAQPASYMVTICVHDRLHLLGSISEDQPVLSDAGAMIDAIWKKIPSRFPTTSIDAYVVMPNHLHGILHLHHELSQTGSHSLGDVIRWFKGASTNRYSAGVTESGCPRYRDRFWHRNYIENNPTNWHRDPENILR